MITTIALLAAAGYILWQHHTHTQLQTAIYYVAIGKATADYQDGGIVIAFKEGRKS